jgi:hypothetical protein
MKAFLKFLVIVIAALAVGSFFLRKEPAAAQRITDWARNSARHIESLLEERDNEAEAASDDRMQNPDTGHSSWLENRSNESAGDGEGASITSGYTLSSEPVGSDNVYETTQSDASMGETMAGTVSEYMSWVKTVTRKYAPLSWELLMRYDGLPGHMEAETVDGMTMSSAKPMDSFMFLEGNSATEILGSMATNVHETAHGYFGNNIFRYAGEKMLLLDWDNVNGFLFLNPEESWFISFPKEKLFPSREIVKEIPRELRTFRFETYVAGTTSTQGQGVIGLLDEYHAYYHGARCSFDLLPAYAEAEGSEVNGLLEWIRGTLSEMTAYYEFDFFIKEYLLRMRAIYPEEYKALRAYTPFREAYKGVSREYSDLIRKYERRVNEKIKELNDSGEFEAEIREGTLWISSVGGTQSRGTSIFQEDRAILEPVLNSGRYDEIESDFL